MIYKGIPFSSSMLQVILIIIIIIEILTSTK